MPHESSGASRLVTAGLYDGMSGTNGTLQTQSFTYDSWGNLTKKVTGSTTLNIGVDGTTNRATASSFDAAGNATSWGVGVTYVWGPFNEMWRMVNGAEDWVYLYDADGERSWSIRAGGGGNRWTLRDLDGKVCQRRR